MAIKQRRSLRPLIAFLGVVAAAAGWSTLLWPPVNFYRHHANVGFWATIGTLLKPANQIYPDGYLVGWLFLISTCLLAIFVPLSVARALNWFSKYVENSEADVSLLQIEVTLRFDESLERCTIVREQLFHANQPGTTAYHYNQNVDTPSGTILKDSFQMNSRIGDRRITSDFVERGSKSSFEAIEIFDKALPTSILATYLPDWIVLLLYEHTSILDAVVVERVGEIVILNDHNGEAPTFQLSSPKRRARNITVSLDFPNSVAPPAAEMKCFVIRDNVVSSIYPKCRPVGDRRVFSAFVSELDKEAIRFQWRNASLAVPSPAIAPIKTLGMSEIVPEISISIIDWASGLVRRTALSIRGRIS